MLTTTTTREERSKATPKVRRSKTTTPAEALADISLKDDRLVPTAEAALLLGVAPKTMREWRSKRTGPTPLSLGTGKRARVVYRFSVLESWARCNVQAWTPTPVGVKTKCS